MYTHTYARSKKAVGGSSCSVLMNGDREEGGKILRGQGKNMKKGWSSFLPPRLPKRAFFAKKLKICQAGDGGKGWSGWMIGGRRLIITPPPPSSQLFHSLPFHAHPFYAVLHALVDLHGGGEDTLTYGENESSSSARRPILLLLLLCSV